MKRGRVRWWLDLARRTGTKPKLCDVRQMATHHKFLQVPAKAQLLALVFYKSQERIPMRLGSEAFANPRLGMQGEMGCSQRNQGNRVCTLYTLAFEND